MRKRICMVVALFCLGALGSCGGGNSGGSVINIAGNWQFTANSTVFGLYILPLPDRSIKMGQHYPALSRFQARPAQNRQILLGT